LRESSSQAKEDERLRLVLVRDDTGDGPAGISEVLAFLGFFDKAISTFFSHSNKLAELLGIFEPGTLQGEAWGGAEPTETAGASS
jgi:hypothetical protein